MKKAKFSKNDCLFIAEHTISYVHSNSWIISVYLPNFWYHHFGKSRKSIVNCDLYRLKEEKRLFAFKWLHNAHESMENLLGWVIFMLLLLIMFFHAL